MHGVDRHCHVIIVMSSHGIRVCRQTGGDAIVVASSHEVSEGEGKGEGASSRCRMVFAFVGEWKVTRMCAIVVKWKKTRGRECCCRHVIT